MLELSGVNVFYGGIHALRDVSLVVRPGEVVTLIGANGAGKTTTLRILATLADPDGGRVEVAGIDRVAEPLRTREVLAYVPAEAGLPARLSGREVVRLFARIQGVRDPDRRTDELLERMGASSYARTPCGELSTGMKRRIVLARALVHDPKVLLLDEPTDGLDVPGRRDVLALVRDLASSGRAVVLSSHIMGEVERVVHRIGIVARGRLLAEGTVSEVLARTNATDLDDAFVRLVAA